MTKRQRRSRQKIHRHHSFAARKDEHGGGVAFAGTSGGASASTRPHLE